MSGVGRNELCPCGSGLKYKRCCALKKGKPSLASRVVLPLIGLLLLSGAIFLLMSLDSGESTIAPQRVWSQEHGHWH